MNKLDNYQKFCIVTSVICAVIGYISVFFNIFMIAGITTAVSIITYMTFIISLVEKD